MASKIYRNESVFKEITKESCYWAGWLSAIAGVDYKKGRIIVKLSNSPDNLELSKGFVKFTEWAGNIREFTNKGHTSYIIEMGGSGKYIQDLEKFGLISTKDKIECGPEVSGEYLTSFILGFYNGHGTIHKDPKANRDRFTMRFAHQNKLFIEWMLRGIEKILGEVSYSIYDRLVNSIKLVLMPESTIRIYERFKQLNLIIKSKHEYFDKYYEEKVSKYNSGGRVDNRQVFSKNDNYFSELSLQSSYWAGFLAADGWVHKGDVLGLGLKIADKCEVERFVDDVKWQGEVKEYSNGKNKRAQVQVSNCAKWINDLRDIYGICERKTYLMGKVKEDISHENKLAYVAGYIDGDGSIQARGGALQLSMVGVVKEHLCWIVDVLNANVGVNLDSQKVVKCYESGKGEFRFSFNTEISFKLLSQFEGINICKMKRKWCKYFEFKSKRILASV